MESTPNTTPTGQRDIISIHMRSKETTGKLSSDDKKTPRGKLALFTYF